MATIEVLQSEFIELPEFEEAKEIVRELCPGPYYDYYRVRSRTHCVHDGPREWSNSKTFAIHQSDLSEEYFDELADDEHAEVGKTSMRLGFADGRLPLVLSHNTPNNSIYILWAEDGHKVLGLFPRVSRHKRFD